jgi:hypothetical protein
MTLLSLRALAVVTCLLGCAAPSAGAAGWQRVTSADGASSDQVGIARASQGELHLAWHHPTGPNTEDLLHTTISSAGALGATRPIQSGWTGFTNPALVIEPSGMRAFWGGIRTTSSEEPNQDLNTALSRDGAGWELQPGSIVQRGAQAYGSSISATVRPDGSTLQTWAGTLGTWAHAGLTPAASNHDYMASTGQYGYDSNLATDQAGRTLMAWYSSAAAKLGVLAQDVAADGSPVGSAVAMPLTGDMKSGVQGRTPLVARPGGGFFVAYPTGYPATKSARLWRVGSGTATEFAKLSGSGNQPVALAANADGRIWVVWVDNRAGRPTVFARRSNAGVTRLGATVSGGRVEGSVATYRLDASTLLGTVDVLASFSIGTTANAATFHRRLQPGLTLAASPARLARGDRRKVRFSVSDAGDPVAGARVTAAGASGRTNAAGRVTIELPGRSTTAKATRAGYVRATTRLIAGRR